MRGFLLGSILMVFSLVGCGQNLGERGAKRNVDRPEVGKTANGEKKQKKDKDSADPPKIDEPKKDGP